MARPNSHFDYDRYQALRHQGLSQNAIAKAMGIPEATLRLKLKAFKVPPQDTPALHIGIPDADIALVPPQTPHAALGIPDVASGPHLQEWQALLPSLQEIAAWWAQRQQVAQEAQAPLQRATYHLAPKWIGAIRREADLTGESYAAVVNRALAQYFAGRAT